ncbi:hypothetical protein [Paraburkholderia phytofirmans]|uniref:Uncharacterized protein n=1 Tax=Paraburkholderia phytofirmans (strain DSM 17436 / LMG 22146 / PsJN) TaxID=398527 RepID=B2TH81_PARPJ|nr:hypothetical protein [Paraburkholderia phytofirmans]ACD21630.1 hypothetical protein Bphyt_7345 [Paraburkholderia phytofirmans PsJN]
MNHEKIRGTVKAAASAIAIKAKTFTVEARKNVSFSRLYMTGCIAGYGLLVLADPAAAQASLRGATESLFNTLYGVVGAAGGVATLVSLINWKAGNFLGAQDPKKTTIHAIMGTAGAFGVVGIIQAIKAATSGSGSSISGV